MVFVLDRHNTITIRFLMSDLNFFIILLKQFINKEFYMNSSLIGNNTIINIQITF